MPAQRIGTSPGPAAEARSTAAALRLPAVEPGSVALYDVDADVIAALVLACPAVAGLSGGPFGAAATYLPGRTVAGIRISPDTVEVHVVARYGPTVGELAGQVRAALVGAVLGRTVDIVVEDLDDGPAAPAGATATTAVPAPAQAAAPVPAVGRVDDPVEVLGVLAASGAPLTAPPATPEASPSRWTRPGRPV